jgi:CRISPR-associated endonuclease/helicase Cas3
MTTFHFPDAFRALTGTDPFPWQSGLFQRFIHGRIPASCNLPTGLGKTSVIPIWLLALAEEPRGVPRRLVYVVNRRTVVDQATREAERLRQQLTVLPDLKTRLQSLCALPTDTPLAISTLRGQFADNAEWRSDPARPTIIVGTVDMIGSRLLFSGYGIGFKSKPLHAGFLGQDALLVHDEAHLEPAFQELLIAIEKEQQRCKEFHAFRVMELSATSRGQEQPFELTEEERNPPNVIPEPPIEPIHVVWRRLTAKKSVHLHQNGNEKKVGDTVADLALQKFRDSRRTVLLFLRRVDDVEKAVGKLLKAKQHVQQLTGTLRGLERDRLATEDPIFRRFLRGVESADQTVFLVCTSAGEVGVNISADHLVCDLSTFESMAQRFGRVNRFGDRNDTEIHVVCPLEFDENDESGQRRRKTLDLLRLLRGDASPKALAELDLKTRLAAFAPIPTILPTSDILFDSWALTTIRGNLPGRPPVEPYLHGISNWEPPQTHVAWRQEVAVIIGDLLERYRPEDLLEVYPLKPHELLRDNSRRVFDWLKRINAAAETPVWIVSDDDSVEVTTLAALIESGEDSITYKKVLLPPKAGGLDNGMLNADSDKADDVADEWFVDADKLLRRRIRVWDDDPQFDKKTHGMRLICRIAVPAGEEEDGNTNSWLWFERPGNADDEGSQSACKPIAWPVHTDDVSRNASQIVHALGLSKELHEAVVLAAQFHDLGKKRDLWQRNIGNPNPKNWLAKSGGKMKPVELTDYRHEFGSLLDVQNEPAFLKLDDELKDLVLHLIAAHHGRGRPHFPPDEAFDTEPKGKDTDTMAIQVCQRFARLQRKYGRWGLAYLESLLRAADWTASARPSAFVEGTS